MMSVLDRLMQSAMFGQGANASVTGIVNVRDLGLAYDGTTDVSSALQTIIDANKGKTILFPDGTYLFSGVTLSGSTYNGTKLIFLGEHKLAQRPATNSSTFGGAWVGLLIKDCDGVELCYRGHGNRAVQPAEEHVYNVGVAAATNLNIPFFKVREVRGDGLYISQSNWTSNTANTVGVNIGHFDAYNTADDGRNALSIISGENIAIGNFRSYKVGGVISAMRMPGGFDIEPNFTYQVCRNITVGSMAIEGAGTGNFTISGKGDATTACVDNVTVGSLSVTCTAAADTNDAFTQATQTGTSCMILIDCANVTINNAALQFTNAYGVAVQVRDAKNCMVKGTLRHAQVGVRVGFSATEGAIGCDFDFVMHDICRWGYDVFMATDSKFRGKAADPSGDNTVHYSVKAPIHIATNCVITDCVFSVDIKYSANWTRTIRQDSTTVTVTNCVVRDCSWTGSYAAPINQDGDVNIKKVNVEGVTNKAAMPSATGAWEAGTFVRANAITFTANKGVFGWLRKTTGNGNVLNTDWDPMYCTNT